MATEAPRRIGPFKGALFSALAVLLTLGTLEGVLAISRRLWDRGDPGLGLDAAGISRLSDTVAFQLSPDRITVADDELIFRLRRNNSGTPLNGYEGIDAQGLRTGPAAPASAKERVVLLAGDSCAFGWGIKQHRETLGARLQECLASRGAGPARVRNVGQPGHSTSQARIFLEQVVPAMRPDLVVLYAGWNDLWETRGLGDDDVLHLLRLGRRAPMRWVRASSTYRLLQLLLRRMLPGKERRQGLAIVESRLLGPTSGSIRVTLPRSRENVARIVEISSSLGARTIVVEPPFDTRRGDLAPMSEYVSSVLRPMEGRATLFRSDALAQAGSEGRFQPDGYHPNAAGTALLAAELCTVVAAELAR